MWKTMDATESPLNPAEMYPHDLQIFKHPPKGLKNYEDLVKYISDRQKLLRLVKDMKFDFEDYGLERVIIQKFITELEIHNLDNYLELIYYQNTHRCRNLMACEMEHISQFVLALAHCQYDDMKYYFVNQEVDLFKFRFLNLTESSKNEFLNIYEILEQYKMLTEDEKQIFKNDLLTTPMVNIDNFDEMNFYKIPFNQLNDLIRKRKVYFHKGFAYLPDCQILSILVYHYKKQLFQNLDKCRRIWKLTRDPRIRKMISDTCKIYKRNNRDNYSNTYERVNIDNLDDLAIMSFPPCMRMMHDVLKRNHKLKDLGRFQYTLYLRGLGIPYEDTLAFLKNEFTKHNEIDQEVFRKQYSYHVAYLYGKKGNKKNWRPCSCDKLMQTVPGPDETHGCPFVSLSDNDLRRAFNNYSLQVNDIEDIITVKSTSQYHEACKRYFESVHGDPPIEMYNNPNRYFVESRKILNKIDREVDDQIIEIPYENNEQINSIEIQNHSQPRVISNVKVNLLPDILSTVRNHTQIENCGDGIESNSCDKSETTNAPEYMEIDDADPCNEEIDCMSKINDNDLTANEASQDQNYGHHSYESIITYDLDEDIELDSNKNSITNENIAGNSHSENKVENHEDSVVDSNLNIMIIDLTDSPADDTKGKICCKCKKVAKNQGSSGNHENSRSINSDVEIIAELQSSRQNNTPDIITIEDSDSD